MKEYKYKLFYLLKKYEIKPKKHLGQNFLIDNSCFLSILKDIDLKNQIVIEIGSGLGGLTSLLIKKSKKVIAIEYDNFLFDVLKKEFKNFNNLELTNIDFLNYEFNSDSKAIVFGNIPYNLTSLILFKLFKNINNIELCYLLLQKEIVEKLVAKAKSSFYNKLSVTSQYFANIKIIKNINATSFFPKPKVDSAIVLLDFKQNININEIDDYLLFVKNIFGQRRKTLINNLKKHYPTKLDIMTQFLKQNNISLSIRAQELKPKIIYQLFLLFNGKDY